ncbi:unnamed protein product [Owenia fusiformis]|uniref:Uncharacterized protein n=1 Tax=Owenia fusiformis TaxID=6347 RepID=A0A8J1UXV2_OWEFU|nr:unnamed protein product [Owenia fusiformis]
MTIIRAISPFFYLSLFLDFATLVTDFRFIVEGATHNKDLLVVGGQNDGFNTGLMAYVSIMAIIRFLGKMTAVVLSIAVQKHQHLSMGIWFGVIVIHDIGIGVFYLEYINCVGKEDYYVAHLFILIPRCLEFASNTIKLILTPLVHDIRDIESRRQATIYGCLYGLCIMGYIGTIVILALISPPNYQTVGASNFNETELYIINKKAMGRSYYEEIYTDVQNSSSGTSFYGHHISYVIPQSEVIKIGKLANIIHSENVGSISIDEQQYITHCYSGFILHNISNSLLNETSCERSKRHIQYQFRYYEPAHSMTPHGKLEYNIRMSDNIEVLDPIWERLNLEDINFGVYMFLTGKSSSNEEIDKSSSDGDVFHNPWSGKCPKSPIFTDFNTCSTGSFHKAVVVIYFSIYLIDYCLI